MGKLILSLEKDTERKFRYIIERVYGKKKGVISFAGESAIRVWMTRNGKQIGSRLETRQRLSPRWTYG